MCQWPVMRQRCPGSLRRGACESCESFRGVKSSQRPSRYGMSGNEAETTNPLRQVLRALFSTSQEVVSASLKLSHTKPAPCSSGPPKVKGPRVYEKAVGGHLACADRSPSRQHPYTYSLSKASSCLCLVTSLQNVYSFETASQCLYILAVGYVSSRYRFGVT